jgi:hypothetical protein
MVLNNPEAVRNQNMSVMKGNQFVSCMNGSLNHFAEVEIMAMSALLLNVV